SESISQTVRQFQCDLCRHPGEPVVQGFLGQANDGQPEPLDPEVLVASANGGSKRVFAGGQAQPGRCALEELEADTLKSSLEGPKIPQPPTKGVPAHPPAGTLCFLARRRDLGRRRSCIF